MVCSHFWCGVASPTPAIGGKDVKSHMRERRSVRSVRAHTLHVAVAAKAQLSWRRCADEPFTKT